MIALPVLLAGCAISKSKYQTPYLVPNVALQGNHWLKGSVIQSTKKRYWLSYEQALKAEGYLLKQGKGEEFNRETIKLPGDFYTYDLDPKIVLPLFNRQVINRKFFEEGYVYAVSICTGYFQQADYTKSQRTFARRESNIVGGLISAALGLAEASVKTVSGVGVAFSALDSSFDAYDSSFLVSPQLGLMEQIVKQKMEEIYLNENRGDFNSIGQVITSLSKISTSCSQTGMQVLVDEAVNDKLQKSTFREVDLVKNLQLKLKEAEKIAQALEAAKNKKVINDSQTEILGVSEPVNTK